MYEKKVGVSIICNTYNHELYIKDALEGFIQQKTNFDYEILIHDDASTDNTTKIIREYEEKYPDIIKPIYRSENQFSKGLIGDVIKEQRNRAKGKYIAVCEGDDYWISPNKLQMQFDIMEKNPSINMCTHRVKHVKADSKIPTGETRPQRKNGILTPEFIIEGGGGIVATNSLFYRKKINETIPRFRCNLDYDYSLQIQGALPNGMLYLDECLSCYRVFAQNSWTSRMDKEVNKFITWNQRVIEMLNEFDEDTNYEYHESVQKAIYKQEYINLSKQEKYKEMIKHPYYKMIGLKHRIRPFIREILKIKI